MRPVVLPAALALLRLLMTSAGAAEITFPLSVDYEMIAASLRRVLELDGGRPAVVWGTADGCRSLVVRDVEARRGDDRVRFVLRGNARLGVGLFGLCFVPVRWDGALDTLGTPAVGRDWQLRFQNLESSLVDPSGQKTMVASRLWNLVRSELEERMERVTIDLGPPVTEATALIRACAPPERAEPIAAALRTLTSRGIRVDDEGVKVAVSIDVPTAEPTPSVPEAPLDAVEIQRWQIALESWDAFLVFVVKDLGMGADPGTKDALFELVLGSRRALVTALAGRPKRGVDPVRELFLQSWSRLRTIARRAGQHGKVRDRVLRYATFLAAGDALAAVDAAAPSLGLEISADGLRRLARILDPETTTDPLAYSEAPDPALQDLFHFHEPESGLPPGESTPPADEPAPESWWWFGPASAYAEPVPPTDIQGVTRRLDRWIPEEAQLREYRDTVARLLDAVAIRERDANGVPHGFHPLFGDLVKAVAWQESCWRQFVRNNGRVTYLLSSTGDIGLMQVNRRVWRGFFDVQKLEWDIAYNAGAGAEILAQLLTRFGAKEEAVDSGNAARATYAAYNGGPGAYRRYRSGRVPRRQRAVDHAFWEKFQAMTAGQALDFVLCVEEWGRTPKGTDQLSTVRPGSTSKRCMSSRSERATPARS